MSRAGVPLRTPSSDAHRESNGHCHPSCRGRAPTCRMISSGTALPSPRDASLSAPRTWPARDRGIGLAAPIGDVAPGPSLGMPLRHGGANHAVAPGGSRRRDAGRDHSACRNEAGSDTARSWRADTRSKTRRSTPPLSGHGARAVVNVTASRHRRLQKARGCRPGPSLFGGPRALRHPVPAGPDPHR